jgi:hypothetical protein
MKLLEVRRRNLIRKKPVSNGPIRQCRRRRQTRCQSYRPLDRVYLRHWRCGKINQSVRPGQVVLSVSVLVYLAGLGISSKCKTAPWTSTSTYFVPPWVTKKECFITLTQEVDGQKEQEKEGWEARLQEGASNICRSILGTVPPFLMINRVCVAGKHFKSYINESVWRMSLPELVPYCSV